MKLRTILLFGSPGAGKGTQGKILGGIPTYLHVSSGDLFRNLQMVNGAVLIFDIGQNSWFRVYKTNCRVSIKQNP